MMTVPTSIGSCHKIGPFPSSGNRPDTFACVYADGVRLGIDEENAAAIELRANARLIAAAPDLLEALIDLVADFGDTPSDKMRSLGPARAAIAKATGSAA